MSTSLQKCKAEWYTVRVKDGRLWDGPLSYSDAAALAAIRGRDSGDVFIVKRALREASNAEGRPDWRPV